MLRRDAFIAVVDFFVRKISTFLVESGRVSLRGCILCLQEVLHVFEKGSSILTSTSRVFGPIAIFKHSNRVSTEKKNEMNISFTVHFDFGLLVFFLFLVLCSLGSLPLCSLFAFSLLTYSSYNALTIICWPCARSTLTIRALLLCQRNSVPPHIKTGYTYLRLLYLPKIG